MSELPASGALRLTCQPSKAGNTLVFPYRLANEGPGEVYAMHALPAGGAAASETAAVVMAGDTGDAIIGKFAPPLPADRRIAVPVVPLARRLPAGATLEGRIEVALPLAETSPYFPDLTLRQYEIVDIKGVVLTIGFWLADTGELVARPSAEGSDLLQILTADPVKSARLATQRFPTTALQLFRRTDAFPRMPA
ncbi:MAG TPA: hypothetical protein VGQ90_04985 [Stellaceae bacterium]|jgi:hypothetical protein|nr:hypothetical protein [Stellaceae bacterium]